MIDFTSNTEQTSNALSAISVELDAAIKFATEQVANVATQQMQALITGRHEPGTPTPSEPGMPPTNITGKLRREIRPVVTGFGGKYVAQVGSLAQYAYQLEFGAPDWPDGVRYPFVAPTATLMQKNDRAKNIFVNAVRYVVQRTR